MAQKYFDALPCFSHDMHATLSRNCKYISFNPSVPCLNVILTNSMQNIKLYNFLFIYFRPIATLGFANYRKESICYTYYYN